MPRLTSAQLAALKADLAANTNTVIVGGTPFAINSNDVLLSNHTGVASPEAGQRVADWYNTVSSPNYWIWRHAVSRADVYNTLSDLNTSWDWTTYKNQSVTEQGAWVQMFMGDVCNFGQLNNRVGIFKIFSGAGGAATQRSHIFAVGRRAAKRIEKLLSAAPVSAGGLTVDANSGNTVADPLGNTTNPAVLGIDTLGTSIISVSLQDIVEAWTS